MLTRLQPFELSHGADADGGGEHSGRVAAPGAPGFYEVASQRTATRLLSGRIGDPAGATWSVEMALAHSDTLVRLPAGTRRPTVGARWRINFSRVERRGDVNWTWGAQVVWEPRRGRYEGKVNMHLPDAWGWVEFAAAEGADIGAAPLGQSDEAAAAAAAEPATVATASAMAAYYALHALREASGSFGEASVAELRARGWLDAFSLEPCTLHVEPTMNGSGFVAQATHRESGVSVSVNEVRLVQRVDGTATCAAEP